MPVSVCVAVTSTPGNTAPLWSLTVPLIWAVAWAKSGLQPRASTNNVVEMHRHMRFIFPRLQTPVLTQEGSRVTLIHHPKFVAKANTRNITFAKTPMTYENWQVTNDIWFPHSSLCHWSLANS